MFIILFDYLCSIFCYFKIFNTFHIFYHPLPIRKHNYLFRCLQGLSSTKTDQVRTDYVLTDSYDGTSMASYTLYVEMAGNRIMGTTEGDQISKRLQISLGNSGLTDLNLIINKINKNCYFIIENILLSYFLHFFILMMATGPPPSDMMFTLVRAEAAVMDTMVYKLMRDLEILSQLSDQLMADSRGYTALFTANQMVNHIIAGNDQ